MLKHLIFDCDGVIIDSEILFAEIAVKRFAELDFHMEPIAYCSRFAGMMDTEILDIIAAETGNEVTRQFYDSLREEVEHAFKVQLKAIKGMPALIHQLPMEVSVVSNSHLAHVKHSLRLTGVEDRFADRVFSSEMVARPKPHPDVYQLALDTIGLETGECWVVEDSVTGVTAARGAGLRVIGFLGGGHIANGHGDELRKAGVEHVVANANELEEIIHKIIRL
jgi:HAD superfamily hydrolase (TIGR01509 family)